MENKQYLKPPTRLVIRNDVLYDPETLRTSSMAGKYTSRSSMIFPTKPPLLMGISLLSMFERKSSFMWIYERFCMGLYGLIWSYWIFILGENKPLTWVPVSWVNRNSWMFIPPNRWYTYQGFDPISTGQPSNHPPTISYQLYPHMFTA